MGGEGSTGGRLVDGGWQREVAWEVGGFLVSGQFGEDEILGYVGDVL